MEQKGDLIEIRPDIFLSKSDSLFYEKYLRYHPKDRYMRYEYGQYLQGKGKLKEARKQFLRASLDGHALSKRKLAETTHKTTSPTLSITQTSNRVSWPTLTLLFVLLTCMALIVYFFPFHSTKPETTNDLSSHSGAFYSGQLTPHDIQYVVVFNAIRHFQNENGRYPKSLSQLTRPYPNNWLSYIPKDLIYSTAGHSFTLEGENLHLPSEIPEITLDYFPETHQIGLYFGQSLLSLYSVADGKNPLPFHTSYVHLRVALPNGPNSALGTRGLYLEKHFAIHGTNKPALIGKSVSHGCLRLNNHNIESIYPYVSKGTPFIVKSGRPSETAFFPKGFPSLTLPTINNETTRTHFHWLN